MRYVVPSSTHRGSDINPLIGRSTRFVAYLDEISTWEGSVRRVYGAICRDKRRAKAAKARTGLAAWLKGMTDMSQT